MKVLTMKYKSAPSAIYDMSQTLKLLLLQGKFGALLMDGWIMNAMQHMGLRDE